MKYNGGQLQRCYLCGGYIDLGRDSHVKVSVGQHLHYLHMESCHKLAQMASHRLITLQVVYCDNEEDY